MIIVAGLAAALRWVGGELRRDSRRWPVAVLLGRLPGTCWADSARWAMNGDDPEHAWWRPLKMQTQTCRADAARCGICWCGKREDPAGHRAWEQHLAEVRARFPDDPPPGDPPLIEAPEVRA